MASKVDDIKRRKSLTAEQRQAKAAKTVASLKRDGLTTSLKVNDDDPDGNAAAAAADAILSKPALVMRPRDLSPDEGEVHEDGQEMEQVEVDAGKPEAKCVTHASEESSDDSLAAPSATTSTTPRTTRNSSKRSADQSATGTGTAHTKGVQKHAEASPAQSVGNPEQPKTSLKLKIRPKKREPETKSRKSGGTSRVTQLPKSTPLLTPEQAANAQQYRQRLNDLGDHIYAARSDDATLNLGLFETVALQFVKADLGLKALLQDYSESVANKIVPPTEDGGHGVASEDDHGGDGPHGETGSAALDDNDGLREVPANVTEIAADTVSQSVAAHGEDAEAKITPREPPTSLPGPSKDVTPDAGSAVDVTAAREPEAAAGDTTADKAVVDEAADEGSEQRESVPQKANQQINQELQTVKQNEIDAAERATDASAPTAINEAVTSGPTSSQSFDRAADRSPKRAIDQVDASDETLPGARSPKQAKQQVGSEQPSTSQSVEPATAANLTDPAAVTSYVAELPSTLGQYTATSTEHAAPKGLDISPTYSTGNRPSDALTEMHDTVEHDAGDVGGAGIESGNGADASALNIQSQEAETDER
ncbi:hypothetical protein LTR59_004207 [Friedmanniomyces endolithicus]|nr:hypothetical protein LTR94_008062 [Friedmanniomyces endolithicus]KAK0801294.1 hypothetical protein LTR38_006866 [Friedmanniomyces endolithicus]KAK0804869.1 hypothetical protein LTR59_004207 [Friedmanniomyces endolithicus]